MTIEKLWRQNKERSSDVVPTIQELVSLIKEASGDYAVQITYSVFGRVQNWRVESGESDSEGFDSCHIIGDEDGVDGVECVTFCVSDECPLTAAIKLLFLIREKMK